MSETVLKIENLSKIYRLGEIGTGTISHDLNRWWANVLGKEDPMSLVGQVNDRTQAATSDYVSALQDINFEVKQGEVLGIIGKNGAGKSTLLKLISKITSPTTGSIKAKGRIASLLEVGTGMHPEMTARENIYLNGAILGMKKWEIKKKFDEIVDFAGIAMYIDTPIKRFSSGMSVRLGFAVAAFLEPEILIVDEVLAVGDAEFQKKAIGKMKEVSKDGGRTVLFVSHNMASIQNLCDRVLILDKGQYFYDGPTTEGINKYLHQKLTVSKDNLENRKDRIGNQLLKFTEVLIKNNGDSNISLQTSCNAEFEISFKIKKPLQNVIFRFIVVDKDDVVRFVCNNFHSSEPIDELSNNGSITLKIKNFPLPDGIYFYHLKGLVNKEVVDEVEFAGEFDVEKGDFFKTGKIPAIKGGLLVDHKWEEVFYE